jgi:hypothetical protein
MFDRLHPEADARELIVPMCSNANNQQLFFFVDRILKKTENDMVTVRRDEVPTKLKSCVREDKAELTQTCRHDETIESDKEHSQVRQCDKKKQSKIKG